MSVLSRPSDARRLQVIGEEVSPGMKSGGFVNTIRKVIHCSCPGHTIPAYIEVDVSNLNIGQRIGLSSLRLPPGVTHLEKVTTICPFISVNEMAIVAACSAGRNTAAACPGVLGCVLPANFFRRRSLCAVEVHWLCCCRNSLVLCLRMSWRGVQVPDQPVVKIKGRRAG